MRRILLVCHQFFPKYYTGTELLTLEVADQLVRMGYSVNILTIDPSNSEEEIGIVVVNKTEYAGHTVWRIPISHPTNHLDRIRTEIYDPRIIGVVQEILDAFRPDLVHAFHLMRLTSSFVETVRRNKIPIFFTLTDYWMVCPTYQLLKSSGEVCEGPSGVNCFQCLLQNYSMGMFKVPLKMKLAIRAPKLASIFNSSVAEAQFEFEKRVETNREMIMTFDRVFAANKFMLDLLHSLGFKGKKENLINFPLPQRAEALRDLQDIGNNEKLRIAFIGTLRPSKGPDVLIKACAIIKKRTDIEVDIWGKSEDKKYEEYLIRLAESVGFVQFRGTFRQEDFGNVLQKIDVVVIPSLWYENTPLTAISAMASKRVLVVSDFGGLSGLVHNGKDGFTFKPGNIEELAYILEKLADDRRLLIKISSQMRQPISVAQYANELGKYYNEII